MSEYPGVERREFFRYRHEKPVTYRVVTPAKTEASDMLNGMSKNLSASGILFTSKHHPAISSIVVLDLDFRTTRICEEVEERALIVNNKVIGKVARIEDNDDGSFDVGVAFVKKTDGVSDEIKRLVD
ncbi:MAG: PilZ domain-containing protein [Candidatus Omnitrophota bacterium]|nr:PilZ domain-containing protein [Candidatus Omnitrophota bacterium]